jgi:hypothetical protein
MDEGSHCYAALPFRHRGLVTAQPEETDNPSTSRESSFPGIQQLLSVIILILAIANSHGTRRYQDEEGVVSWLDTEFGIAPPNRRSRDA